MRQHFKYHELEEMRRDILAMAKTLDYNAQATVHIYDFMCSVLMRDKKSAPNGAGTPNGASNQKTTMKSGTSAF